MVDKRTVDRARIAALQTVDWLTATNARLTAEVSKWKERCESLANFNPDWDMLEATQSSLREHMVEIKRLRKAITGMRKLTSKGSPADNIGKFAMKMPARQDAGELNKVLRDIGGSLK